MGQEVVVTNFPAWTLYVVAIAQIIFALAVGAIAVVMVMLVGQLKTILADVNEHLAPTLEDVNKITGEVSRNVPGLLNEVHGTIRNVKTISDDARDTSHNVTSTVNRVSHVVGSVAGRMESPLVKMFGVASGVAAGLRTLSGKKEVKEVVVEPAPKRGGLLGLFR